MMEANEEWFWEMRGRGKDDIVRKEVRMNP